jgi:hypothetical protein
MSAFGVTKTPWRPGKIIGTVVADEPVRLKSGHDDIKYYGGHLIAESIAKVADRDRIVLAVNAYDDLKKFLKDFVAWAESPGRINDTDGRLLVSHAKRLAGIPGDSP